MATITRFEDLEIWQEARRLANEINIICIETELKTDYRFKDQIKAASGSVMDNIAEGFERNGNGWHKNSPKGRPYCIRQC
jgi:four helix bundle protein